MPKEQDQLNPVWLRVFLSHFMNMKLIEYGKSQILRTQVSIKTDEIDAKWVLL